MDEREWCRENGVARNTYEKYKQKIDGRDSGGKEPSIGTDRKKYFEIPIKKNENDDIVKESRKEARTESTDRRGYISNINIGQEDRGRFASPSNEKNEELVIRARGCCLYIREGVRESTLRTVMKVVRDDA